MSNDVTFNIQETCFNYRVAAIVINDGRLLAVKHNKSPYYYSVGGRVKINETSENAIIRELKEETGIDFEIERLGFVHENFFIEEVTKIRLHQIAFFYYVKPLGDIKNMLSEFSDDDLCGGVSKNRLVWLPIDRLSDYKIYPEFFKTELSAGRHGVKHVITNEEHPQKDNL